MEYKEILLLESNEPIDIMLLIRLAETLHQKNINMSFLDDDFLSYEEFQKLIIEKGASYILSIIKLEEAYLPKAKNEDERDLLIRILNKQLVSLNPSESIIIIDPYFFLEKTAYQEGYIDLIREVFKPVVPQVGSIIFITKSNYDPALYQKVAQIFARINPKIRVFIKTTEDFHDRWWIVDEVKGLFIGTSLNGIGRKYALSDYIDEKDVADIMHELRKQHLL